MNAIYKFVLGLIGKRSGVVTTLPNQKQIEFQANMLAEKFMQNGIDPNAFKSPEQVKNVLANIDQANMRVISADSAEGRGITEQLLGKKKADVMDMEGNKIDTSTKLIFIPAILFLLSASIFALISSSISSFDFLSSKKFLEFLFS